MTRQAVDPSGALAICDRENHRVQLFTTDGTYVDEWRFHRPVAIATRPDVNPYIYVVELGPEAPQRGVPNLGLKVRVVDQDGKAVRTFGAGTLGTGAHQFIAPHGVSVDSFGDVYIAEVSASSLVGHGERAPLGEVISLRKWRAVM